MANRGHTKDGDVVCSECGAVIEATAETCEHCGEPLSLDFDAKVCPYCATVLDSETHHCGNCGLRFKGEDKGAIRSKEDEEFLSRLLEWGRKLESKRTPATKADKVETEKAGEIFKDVLGVAEPHIEAETFEELKKSAEEREEFEKREQSILQIAQPLQKALELRKHALNGAEGELALLKHELETLAEDDTGAIRKRSEVERRMAEISMERGAIQSLEENIENMDGAYRSLLEQHRVELLDKESNLQTRLDAFKNEMRRREQEKDKLRSREEFLMKKEDELDARIKSLKERETSLKKTENKLKKEIEALKSDKTDIGELKDQATEFIATKGKWLVDEKEIRSILKKSKSVRGTWLKEQREIQKAFASGESVEQMEQESGSRFREREKELEDKIAKLENDLINAQKEDKKVSKEEAKLGLDEKKLKKVLKVLDDLLGQLSDEEIENFVKTKEFKLYEELMDALGL